MSKTQVVHFITAIIRHTRCYYTRNVTIAQLNVLEVRGQIKGLGNTMYMEHFLAPDPTKLH